MSNDVSLRELLSDLESRIGHHRERRDFHAGQEGHHRDRRAFHEAELEAALKHHEAVKSAVEAAEYASSNPSPTPPNAVVQEEPPPQEEIPLYGTRPMVSRLITRVVEGQPAGQPFGANGIAAQVNGRYREELPKPVAPAAVSLVLRRLRRQGRLRMVRTGNAGQETLYERAKE